MEYSSPNIAPCLKFYQIGGEKSRKYITFYVEMIDRLICSYFIKIWPR